MCRYDGVSVSVYIVLSPVCVCVLCSGPCGAVRERGSVSSEGSHGAAREQQQDDPPTRRDCTTPPRGAQHNAS